MAAKRLSHRASWGQNGAKQWLDRPSSPPTLRDLLLMTHKAAMNELQGGDASSRVPCSNTVHGRTVRLTCPCDLPAHTTSSLQPWLMTFWDVVSIHIAQEARRYMGLGWIPAVLGAVCIEELQKTSYLARSMSRSGSRPLWHDQASRF
jgi:hypothetical protein